MSKILNYIANGRGLGVKYLLIFSLISAIAFGLLVRFGGTDFIPYAQSVADQLLPIKVTNGQVVEPVDTVRTASLNFGGVSKPLPFVIDTTTNTLDTENLRDGVYLTRGFLYTVSRNQVKLIKLEGSFDLARGDYTPQFTTLLNWTALFSFVFGAVFFFVFFFMLSIFYTACSYAVSKVQSKQFEFDLRMRLSVLCLITAYIVFLAFDMVGLHSSKLLFFIAMIAAQAWVFHKLPSQEVSGPAETTASTQK